MGSYFTFGTVKLFDHCLLQDFHALFFKRFLRKCANFFVFNWQNAVHDFNHSRVSTQRVVEAGKFNSDRTRTDHQQFFWHAWWCQCGLVCPNQITICLQARQFTRTRTCGQNDVLGCQLLRAFFTLNGNTAFGRNCRLAHEYGDFVFLHQVTDATGQLTRDAA